MAVSFLRDYGTSAHLSSIQRCAWFSCAMKTDRLTFFEMELDLVFFRFKYLGSNLKVSLSVIKFLLRCVQSYMSGSSVLLQTDSS